LRRYEPFLIVSCGTLPNDCIDNELFGDRRLVNANGHQKFETPDHDGAGKIIAARRGTVLLDEVDSLSLEQQTRLLRVIESGEFQVRGATETKSCRASFILTSQPAIQSLVQHHQFQAELYERLLPSSFMIPPLRHRKMDIVLLARKFINQLAGKYAIAAPDIHPAFLSALMEFPWPGNVRELQHVVEQAISSCRDGHLTLRNLPRHILPTSPSTADSGCPAASQNDIAEKDSKLASQVAWNEKEIIEQTLFKQGFSRTRTADQLGISRVTLYNKMKKYGIQH